MSSLPTAPEGTDSVSRAPGGTTPTTRVWPSSSPRSNSPAVRRRRWWTRPRTTDGNVVLFGIGKVAVTRYRHRPNIPTPWSTVSAA
jgi:hypothetical protein